jgi:glycine/D-amino acid oxidase-like deaminating enzyme
LFLRSVSTKILLVESESQLLDRASRVNQARIHTGFHYPRNALTAVKSMRLHQRFARDFPEAVVDDFQMLYAIARYRSKVLAKRFFRMYHDMGAPIQSARPSQRALFDPTMIEEVFACTEYAFDYSILRQLMAERLERSRVELRMSIRVDRVEERGDHALVHLSDGTTVRARFVFNVTYAGLNTILRGAGLPSAALKYEMTEIALVAPPPDLEGIGVTVMDGPFFSTMPYPAEQLHSLTHVRYTPHSSWTDSAGLEIPPPQESQFRHMIADARRYLPAMADAVWQKSLFDIKTVLLKNEQDDGRPILFQRRPEGSRVISIMGSKIDNIYDLFDQMRLTSPEWKAADTRFLLGTA